MMLKCIVSMLFWKDKESGGSGNDYFIIIPEIILKRREGKQHKVVLLGLSHVL